MFQQNTVRRELHLIDKMLSLLFKSKIDITFYYIFSMDISVIKPSPVPELSFLPTPYRG